MRRLLFVLGSSPTALAVVREAGRAGLAPHVLDRAPGPAMRSRYTASFRVVSTPTAVLDEIRRHPGTGPALIADSDHWLRFVVEYRGELCASNVEVLHPDNAVLTLCLDKRRFHEWCHAQGFDSPAVFDPDEPEDTPLPVVIRPAQTHHTSPQVPKTILARTGAELERGLVRYRSQGVEPVVTRALLDAATREISVALSRRADGEAVSFAVELTRPPADRCATATLVTECRHPEAETLAREVASRMGFVGIGELEFVTFGGTLHLIEVNPRPWGQYAMVQPLDTSGPGFLTFLLKRHRPPARHRPRVWLNFRADAYWCFSRSEGLLRTGRLSLATYLRTLWRSDTYPIWAWRDPWPLVRQSVLPRFE
jgi:predicted ATP-grasp superfamily ATP-dependent carboligase